MKLRAALLLCACMVLCSCESSTVTSQVKQDGTSSETTASQAITTAEESVGKITVPTTFTEDEEWLHSFIEQNFEAANKLYSWNTWAATAMLRSVLMATSRS